MSSIWFNTPSINRLDSEKKIDSDSTEDLKDFDISYSILVRPTVQKHTDTLSSTLSLYLHYWRQPLFIPIHTSTLSFLTDLPALQPPITMKSFLFALPALLATLALAVPEPKPQGWNSWCNWEACGRRCGCICKREPVPNTNLVSVWFDCKKVGDPAWPGCTTEERQICRRDCTCY